QLYLLVIHLLERAKNICGSYVSHALSKIFEDMWKRATICGLKENIEMKNENTLMNKHNSKLRFLKSTDCIDFQLLAISNQHWDIARYCIEQGAYIAVNSLILRTPFENIMKFIMKYKKNKNCKEYLDAMDICKLILKQRTIYPMERIRYAIDYVKDKLIDQNGVIKIIDEDCE
ncbi:hypothetical protein RFI_22520, partial [Reticulomyxa filosa]